MKLYRPVGQREFDLIKESGYKEFPPRLEWQPVFYPILNREYAQKIAGEWNVKDEFSGYVGYVMEFEIDGEYLRQYDIKTVGSSIHQEYWIPDEKLAEFNRHIVGLIRGIEKFEKE
jgi:hypothetical protein